MATSINKAVKTKNLFGQTPKKTNRVVDTFVSGQGQEKATQAKQLSQALNQVVGATKELTTAATEVDKQRAIDAAYRSGEVKAFDKKNPEYSIFSNKASVERAYNVASGSRAGVEYRRFLEAKKIQENFSKYVDPLDAQAWIKDKQAEFFATNTGYNVGGLGFNEQFEKTINPYINSLAGQVDQQALVYKKTAQVDQAVAVLEAHDPTGQKPLTETRAELLKEMNPKVYSEALGVHLASLLEPTDEYGTLGNLEKFDEWAALTKDDGKPILDSPRYKELKKARVAANGAAQAANEKKQNFENSVLQTSLAQARKESNDPQTIIDSTIQKMKEQGIDLGLSEDDIRSDIEMSLDKDQSARDTTEAQIRQSRQFIQQTKEFHKTEQGYLNAIKARKDSIATQAGKDMFQKLVDMENKTWFDDPKIEEGKKAILEDLSKHYTSTSDGFLLGSTDNVKVQQATEVLEDFWFRNLKANVTPQELRDMTEDYLNQSSKFINTQNTRFELGQTRNIGSTVDTFDPNKPAEQPKVFTLDDLSVTSILDSNQNLNVTIDGDNPLNIPVTMTEIND